MNDSDKLIGIRMSLRMTQRQMGDALGIKSQSLSNVEAGGRPIPKNLQQLLVEKLNVNPSYLLTGEGPMFAGQEEPAAGAVVPSCGLPTLEDRLVPYLEQMVGAAAQLVGGNRILEIPGTAGLPPLRALQMPGDNMVPTIRQGDVVVCTCDGFSGDGLYVYRDAGFCQVKRLARMGEMWRVSNDNPAYGPWDAPAERLEVVGRVIYIILRV